MNNSLYVIENLKFEFKKKQNTDQDKSKNFNLDIDHLEIAEGKLTSILGRSGSGKTTLLSLLGLLRRPDKGNIIITLDKANDINELWKKDIEGFRAKNLGFALQRGELLPHLSLYENAALILRFLNKKSDIIKESLDKIFGRLYKGEQKEGTFDKVIHSKPFDVSQGQYQRGAIARALANEPAIILADEPTGNLDQHTGREAMTIFKEIIAKDKNKSVIVVTHDLLLAIDFADEIIVLSNGKVKSHYCLLQDGNKKRIWHRKLGNEQIEAISLNIKDQLLKDMNEDSSFKE